MVLELVAKLITNRQIQKGQNDIIKEIIIRGFDIKTTVIQDSTKTQMH